MAVKLIKERQIQSWALPESTYTQIASENSIETGHSHSDIRLPYIFCQSCFSFCKLISMETQQQSFKT